MKKIKLAIVSPYPPSQGTLNEYAYHLVKNLKSKEEIEEILILTDKFEGEDNFIEWDGNVKVIIKQSWDYNSYSNIFKINNYVKEYKPDLVLFNIQYFSFGNKILPATLSMMTSSYLRSTGIPTVSILHSIPESMDLGSAGVEGSKLKTSMFKSLSAFATRMILKSNLVTVSASKYVKLLSTKYGAENVALVPHGSFDLPPLPDLEERKDELKVMTFGKFGNAKKVEAVIEAVAKVRSRIRKDIGIVIAGADSPNHEGYLDNVKRKYAHIPDIQFTGYVKEQDVPQLFQDATAVLYDYKSSDGSSGVLHRAGSYGKAAIIPKIGELQELVEEEGYAGEYFEPGDIEGLAKSVEKLLVDDQYRNELSRKNYLAAASLPMDEITDWYVMHFQEVIKDFEISKL